MNETIGKNIRLLREYNNMSQQELADKLYITRQSISKWESGLVAPDLEKLLKMSELFNVKIDDLLNDNFIINKKKLSKVMFFFDNVNFNFYLAIFINLFIFRNCLLFGCQLMVAKKALNKFFLFLMP